MSSDALHRLDAVARHLPFEVADYEAANDAFARWRESGELDDQQVVDLWLYCYVQRYFILRFMRERGAPSALDRCVSLAVARARRAYNRIEKAERFASYVSVTCKNTLLNHRRDRREMTEVTDQMEATPPVDAADHDLALVRHVIARVLEEMPEAVREIGRLRILDGLDYEAIAEATNRPLPTVRTYASRATNRLRDDERVRALYFGDILDSSSLPADSRGSSHG